MERSCSAASTGRRPLQTRRELQLQRTVDCCDVVLLLHRSIPLSGSRRRSSPGSDSTPRSDNHCGQQRPAATDPLSFPVFGDRWT